MNKTIKIVSVMLLSIMLMVTLSTGVMATSVIEPEIPNDNPINSVGSKILGIIVSAGMVIAVIILAILGIKYMMGSASEKAEYKKTMIPYLVGAILLFGASGIAQVVINMANTITAT